MSVKNQTRDSKKKTGTKKKERKGERERFGKKWKTKQMLFYVPNAFVRKINSNTSFL